MILSMNIIGANNLGKRDLQEKQVICQKCGQFATLRDYETTSWFFVIIPLVPLGKRKILNHCTSCSAHKSIRLQDWEAYRNTQIRTAVTAYAENLHDPQAAIAAHHSLTTFGRPAEALEVENALVTQFRDNPSVLWYLADYYRQQGRVEQSERFIGDFLRLVAYDPNVVSQVALARILWQQQDEAEKLLGQLAQSSPAHCQQAYLLLAETYQKQGKHAQALEYFQSVSAANPSFLQNSSFREMVRRSEKALRVDPFYKRRGLLITAAVILPLVIMASVNLYKSHHRTLHVVNGLPVPIEVVIDGQKKQIPANQHLPVVLAEGEHQGELLAPPELAEHFEFQIHTPWWQRFTHSPAFVLDPARATVFGKLHRISAAHHEGEMRIEGTEYFIGQLYTSFGHIDQAFPPPGRLEFKKNKQETVRKTFLEMIESFDLFRFLASSDNNHAIEKTAAVLERHLMITRDGEQLLSLYRTICYSQNEPDRYQKLLERRLSQRPVNLPFHLAYQEHMIAAGEGQASAQYYENLLAAEPNNPHILFLNGKLLYSLSEAIALYRRALVLDEGHIESRVALIDALTSKGDQEGVREAMQPLIPLNPAVVRELPIVVYALLYSEDARTAIGELRRLSLAERADAQLHGHYLTALACWNEWDQLQTAQRNYEQFIQRIMTPEETNWSNYVSRFMIAQLKNDHQEILKLSSQNNELNSNQVAENCFLAYLGLNDLEKARKLYSESGLATPENTLCLSLAERDQGNDEDADLLLTKVLTSLFKHPEDPERGMTLDQFHALGQAVEGIAFLRDRLMPNSVKAMLLLELARVSGTHRQELLAAAERLNFSPVPPRQLIAAEIKRIRELPSANQSPAAGSPVDFD